MNLENRFFYRLVTVMHYFLIITCTSLIACILFANAPPKSVDNDKSSVTCKNSKNYSLNKANLFIDPFGTGFDDTNDNQAKILCKYGPPNTDQALIGKLEKSSASKNSSLSDWEIVVVPIEKNYSLNLQYKEIGCR